MMSRPESAEERAERRRRTWTGGVARSFDEAEQMDLAFWQSMTPVERIRATTELIFEMPWEEGRVGPSDRLQRAVGGVRPLKG